MIFSRFIIYKPNYLILIFDYNRKNFRNDIYKKYKINRKIISTNLLKYIKFVKKKLFIWNIKYFNIPNVEGDDVISSLIYKYLNNFKKKNIIYILSYDKDLLQLISSNVFLLVRSDILFNKKLVFIKYGIYPKLLVDFLSLCGDKSDNIPGIKGIGIKTASILLNKIGKISKIYKNLKKIKLINIKNSNNIIKNLKLNINNIKIWYNLIKLRNNLKLNFKLDKFKINYYIFNNIFYKINILKK